MADRDFNTSLIFISHRPLNLSAVEKTVFDQCRDMPAVLIWYLSLQFTNMLLGIPANLMVLWLIRKSREDSTSDIFIFQLAILDVFFCLIPPLELVNLVFFSRSSSWYILLFFYGMKDFSPLFLSCICLDRYMAVIHPVTFTRLKDGHHRTALVVVVWLLILVYAWVKCLGTVSNFDKVFTAMILMAFSFMVFCNIVIIWALRQSGPGRDDMHPVKKRAFKMVLIILAIILFNYLPAVALFPFKSYFTRRVFRCYIHYIAFGLMDFSSSIQPLLYLSNSKVVYSICCQNNEAETP